MKYVLLLALFSTSAFAHFQIGTYVGTDINGQACTVKIKSVSFTNNLKHPLAENVEIEVPFHNETRTFSHLAIVDSTKGTVRPKKEILSSVSVEKTGASAYELIMDEAGPAKMVYMKDNYVDRTQSILMSCDELLYQVQ